MKSIFRFFVKRHLLANALTIMILLMGLYSAFTLNREAFPNANPGIVMINTAYPGASPEDVELNVTNTLEDALKSVVGIKTMTSSSLENFSTITIEIDEDADQDEVYDEIQDAVARVTDFPDEVETPEVSQMEPARKSVLEVGLGSTIWSYPELREYAHQFEKKLLDVLGVAQVTSTGYREREVHIEVSPDKLVKYGISMTEIMQAIDKRNIRASGGSLESYTSQRNVVTLAKFRDPLEVGEVIIKSYPSSAVVTVNDVATVYDDFEEESVIPRINGKPTISFNIIKNENAANRLQPFILTTATTVAGLLPLVYGTGGEDTMMGPMAMALGYGLLFATPVTLVLLPCLYMIWDDLQRLLATITQWFRKTPVAEPVS